MTCQIHNPRITFVHIPKNAGTSLTKYFVKHCRAKHSLQSSFGGKHAPMSRIAKYDSCLPLGEVVVCIRNPFSRIFSAYHYYIRRKKDWIKRMSFEHFVLEGGREKNNWSCVEHPNAWYFDSKYDKLTILRYENLLNDDQEEMEKVRKLIPKLKNKVGIPWENSSKSKKKDWRNAYTPEMIDKVYKKHKVDFDLFGYSFE